MKTFQVYTIIPDSSPDTSPSASSLSSNTESQVTSTSQTRNVTPVTPSKGTRSLITVTSSVLYHLHLLQIDHQLLKFPITSRSQPNPKTLL